MEKQKYARRTKRKGTKRELSLNERVEVRSEEDGFQGSWHSGTVIACRRQGLNLKYEIKYYHFLSADGSDYLVDQVSVCTDCANENWCNHRGLFRPAPPPFQFGANDLPYGMCVDVHHQDAWWEGVIFDQGNGLKERKVFFPDLGDEMMANINKLRVTQDWNEVNETWSKRGTWLFLELIKKYEEKQYIPVSIKQLWYDLREKESCEKLGDWTCTVKALWKELVLESIHDNLKVLVNHLLQVIGIPEATQQPLQINKPVNDVNMYREEDLAKTHSIIIPVENSINDNLLLYPSHPNVESTLHRAMPNFSCISQSKKPHQLNKINVQTARKSHRKRKDSLHVETHFDAQNTSQPKSRNGKTSGGLIVLRNDKKKQTKWARVLRSSKRVQHAVAPDQSHHKTLPRTVLSWLIDNDIVLPRTKVCYGSRKNRNPAVEGRITRYGIKCSCCGKVYNLSSFELHASRKSRRSSTSKYCKPAASIFLDDGRSLLDCQIQLMRKEKMYNRKPETPYSLKGSWDQDKNDHVCSICHDGGELILCDQCPSSFHKICLGMKDIPDGDWFCPSCCCKICGKDTEDFVNDAIKCTQCDHKYHIMCLRNRGTDKWKHYRKGNLFCSKKCEMIFVGLQKLLGKPIPVVGVDNFTWTLFRSMQSNDDKLDASDDETLVESYSKLSIALDVMHECFKPVKEPSTRRDLMKDVIFSIGSELNRLNFQGFYTILLEKDDELITVATVRIHGDNVAEIPLVGTRFQYRRLGMCRILMDVLEKKLMELGVQRLILPAVPDVLNTWTGSFGFSKMTESERLQFVDYTFLDFQDAVMCQKLLVKLPSAQSSALKEIQPTLLDDVFGTGQCIVANGSSPVSEALQTDQNEDGGIME